MIPRGLSSEHKRLWKLLFSGLKPKNNIEIEMAKRYLDWFSYYHAEKAVVDSEGTTGTNRNGSLTSSPHYVNMGKAEGEMRRLHEQLEKSMGVNEAGEDSFFNGES